jgi:hypothetical protein
MIKINKNNFEFLGELYLHDMELSDIMIDYKAHLANIILLSNSNDKNNLQFEGLKQFSIGIFENWGEGMYINEIINSIVKDNYISTIILLNSGDKIEILSKEVKYQAEQGLN